MSARSGLSLSKVEENAPDKPDRQLKYSDPGWKESGDLICIIGTQVRHVGS